MRELRKWLALVLSAVMVFGAAAVPTQAAGAEKLAPAEAAAYLKVLYSPPYAQNSYLEDMNGDGKPELITAEASQEDTLHVEVWTIRGGKAERMIAKDFYASTGFGGSSVGISRSTGQIRLYAAGFSPRAMEEWYTFFNLDGTEERQTGEADPGDRPEIVSPLEALNAAWDCKDLFQSGGGLWEALDEGSAADALQDYAAQEKSIVSGNGLYTVQYYEYSGDKITITFETTKVEKCTVLLSDDGYYENEADGAPQPRRVTMVSVRPGSMIAITGSTLQMDGKTYVWARHGTIAGNECFLSGQSAFELFSGPVENSFQDATVLWSLQTTDKDGEPIFIRLGEETSPTVGGFNDVKESDYYAAPVAWAVEKGITTGTSATRFSPNDTCTTGQILTFLWRANGAPKAAGGNPFADVSAGDYYYQAALWAREKGLVSGTAFKGDAPCTRAETVTYLWKLAGQPAGGAASFADVPADAGYAKAVAWAVKEGITSGTGNNAFSPNATCTRGQIVTFLYRDMA